MRRDWLWAFAATLAAVLLVIGVEKRFALLPRSEAAFVGTLLPLLSAVFTVTLYLKNRHSIRVLERSGRVPELIIRPLDAARRFGIVFPILFALRPLFELALHGPPVDWLDTVTFSTTFSLWLALSGTAYRRRA